jgi:hypothetical protein
LLLAGGVVVEKAKKRCAIRKVGDGGKGEGKDVGPGWSERLRERVLEATPVEIQLSRTRLKAGCARVAETGNPRYSAAERLAGVIHILAAPVIESR